MMLASGLSSTDQSCPLLVGSSLCFGNGGGFPFEKDLSACFLVLSLVKREMHEQDKKNFKKFEAN